MHHEILGLALDEWGSIVAILGGLGGVVGLIIKMTSVMNKLQNSIDTLNTILHGLVNDNRTLTGRVDDLEDKLEVHIGEAKVRNQRITALEKEVFNHYEDNQ